MPGQNLQLTSRRRLLQFLAASPLFARNARTGILIGADHLPHILGIKSRRQGSRPHEVAEHDRLLANRD
jgi:hypothetical protein